MIEIVTAGRLGWITARRYPDITNIGATHAATRDAQAFRRGSTQVKSGNNGGFPIRGSNAKPDIEGEAADADCKKGITGETAIYHRFPCATLRERGEL
jgi:hypothetical protein